MGKPGMSDGEGREARKEKARDPWWSRTFFVRKKEGET
jgi:hypothetical protein